MKNSRSLIVFVVAGMLAAAFLGWIVWGQIRKDIVVPKVASWAHEVSMCPDSVVDPATFSRAVALLVANGQAVRAESGPCDGRPAIHVSVSPADVDRVSPPVSGTSSVDGGGVTGQNAAEAFERKVVGELVVDCDMFLDRADDLNALVHGSVHCMGYEDLPSAPVGHVMNKDYSRIGLDDFRGL